MALVVSVKVRCESKPETKVSEQSTLATKPVATPGTSRARAAPRARPTKAKLAVRRRIRRRRVNDVLRLGLRAGDEADPTLRRSPDLEITPPRFAGRLADSGIIE